MRFLSGDLEWDEDRPTPIEAAAARAARSNGFTAAVLDDARRIAHDEGVPLERAVLVASRRGRTAVWLRSNLEAARAYADTVQSVNDAMAQLSAAYAAADGAT